MKNQLRPGAIEEVRRLLVDVGAHQFFDDVTQEKEFDEMTIPDNTATLFEQDRATNDKVLATDAAAVYLWKQFERQEERLAALEAQLSGERHQLFSSVLGQQQQMFQSSLPTLARIWANGATLDVKTLDKDTNEVNSESIGAEVVAGLAPEIRQAIDAAVAKNVNLTGTADNAMAAAIAKAVVEALSQRPQ